MDVVLKRKHQPIENTVNMQLNCLIGDTAEVTRLGIKKLMRKKSKRQAVMAIYKGIYLWSILNDVRYLYLVAEKKMFRAFTITGFPCKRIGPVKTLNGGVESLATAWQRVDALSFLWVKNLR